MKTIKKLFLSILATVSIGALALGMVACGEEEHAHAYTKQTTPATCAEKGIITYTCECGDTYTEEVPATGKHMWDNGMITVNPTCTKKGVKTFTCTVCKTATYKEEVNTIAHDIVTHEAKAPTCTEIGWNAYVTCKRKGCTYSTFQKLPVTDVHTWDNGEITTEPTCTKKGVKTFTCTVCERASYTEPVDETSHNHATEFTKNTTHHWYECICGDKKDEEKHTPSAPATATTPQTCTICGYVIQEETGILFNTLSVNGTTVYGKVSNTTTEFSFINEVTVKGNATFIVDDDKDCNTPIRSKTVDLEIGDNVFYVLEMIGDDVQLFTVTIRRRPMYEVTFHANGGTAVEKQVIEEDSLAAEPETTKAGYTFTGWDYDFTSPIVKDTEISASWSVNTDTKYTVNYYLQNLEDNAYTLKESVELSGQTNTTATAEIKEYAHFTYNQSMSTVSGNIDGDHSRVLSVYYTRNKYTLSVHDSALGSITNAGEYKYGKEITTTATPDLGYNICWYRGDECISTALTLTFTVEQNVVAKFEMKEEMSNFHFTSTATACTITGIKDKTATEVEIPDYVTSIGDYAFNGCNSLTEIVIPDSVTSIGDGAFKGCNRLTEITIPFAGATKDGTSNTHFGYLFGADSYSDNDDYVSDSLKKVTITNATSIGRYAFRNCYSLKEIVIPNSVTSIGYEAFRGCNSLTSVTIGANSQLTSIGGYAFYGCNGLTSVTFGKNSQLNDIGPYVFYNCYSLTEIEIPNSVTSIGDYAFYGCSSLTQIVIPNSVTSIGWLAFYNCSSLTNITVDENNPNYKSIDGNLYSKDGTTLIQYAIGKTATSFTIPNSVTIIGSYAFYNCDCLTQIVIPNSVTSIGGYAFEYCSSLTEIVIPDSVTSIGGYAFSDCSSLTQILIPNSVTSIGYYAFSYCDILTIYCEMESQPSRWDSYWNYSNCPVVWDCKNNDEATDGYIYMVIDGVRYGIKDGVATVKEQPRNITSVNIPEKITYKSVEYTVTSIGEDAFWDCSSLTEIVIPNSVTRIGEETFWGCSSLTEIVIPNSVTSIGSQAFYNCRMLTSIMFGENSQLNDIGNYVFSGCDSLKEIVIPASVTSIGSYAFQYCSSLTEIVIPASVTSIGGYAFYECDSLISVTFGENFQLTSIGVYAFEYCRSLTEIVIPNSVTSIGEGSFEYCSSLTSVTFGENSQLASIGGYAFWYCRSLTEIVIPNSVTYIGEDAFAYCSSLTNITVDENNPNYKSIDGNLYSKDGTTLIQYAIGKTATSFTIPNSVTIIGNDAFYNCDSLTEIAIPNSVTSIGDYAFAYCDSLTEIVIPNSVTTIGEYAFSDCSSLTQILIPNSVTSIGYYAFSYCDILTEIVIPDSVTSIGNYAFYNCDSLTIYCEVESQPSGWDSKWNYSNRPVVWGYKE